MRNLFWGLIAVGLFACGGGNKPSAEDITDILEETDTTESSESAVSISPEVVQEFIEQIPQPTEIAVVLKNSGAPYNNEYLNKADNVSKYNNSYTKALNLGIYGTDLGYTNIYEKNQDAIFYLNSIRDLADDLSIGQFFQFGTIKRLATQSQNLDSLLLITTQNFNDINAHLQSKKRSNLSVLLLAGSWLEAVYITCKVAEETPGNQRLMEKIGEQKIVCENIKFLLSIYKDKNPFINSLFEDMSKLNEAFEAIQIEVIYGEPRVEIVDGMAVVVDTTEQKIEVTQEDIDRISAIVAEIRSKIVS